MTQTTDSIEITRPLAPFTRSPVLRTALGEILPDRESEEPSAEHALRDAIAWVARAQDACANGSVSAGFRIVRGWRAADLETTAAAIPLFADHATSGGAPFRGRARRAAAAIPTLLGASDLRAPARLALALAATAAWAPHVTSARRAEMLERLSSVADDLLAALDGAPDESDPATGWAQAARAAAGLCAAAGLTGEMRFAGRAEELLDGAAGRAPLREVAAALARRPASRSPVVGGVAALPLLLRDLRDAAIALGRADILALATAEGEVLLRRFELRRRLAIGKPRVARARDARHFSPLAWSGAALFWIEEFERGGDPRPLNAALGALDALAGVQRNRPGVDDVHGAVPSSVPAWPRLTAPVFDALAAVLLARALVARRRALRAFDATIRRGDAAQPADVPRGLPTPPPAPDESVAPRVVLYASPDIHRAPRMLEQWRGWGFAPAAIVMEHRPPPPLARRIRNRIAMDGVGEALRRATRRVVSGRAATPDESTIDYCARRGIRVVHVGALDAPETAAAIRALEPDLAIHVGTGILRATLLAVPRLGTLNIHNGILPRLRGVNVAEWACLLGRPVGCTVHLVDPGVDTGDILLVREVDTRDAGDIAELRRRVNRDQPGILGEVVRWIVRSGALPPRRAQRAEEGRQYFAMHETLRRMLTRRLEAPAEERAMLSADATDTAALSASR